MVRRLVTILSLLGPSDCSLPRWLEPGALTISHIERDDGWFAFILTLRHPLFGEIIRQTGLLREHLVRNGEDKQRD